MITINVKKKTNANGRLVIDVNTQLIEKDVDVVLVIQEKEPKPNSKSSQKKGNDKFNFSELCGKLEWKGNALAEQRKIRAEWK